MHLGSPLTPGVLGSFGFGKAQPSYDIFNLNSWMVYTGTSLPAPKQLCANLSKVSPNPAEKMLSGQPGGPRMYPRSGYFLVTFKIYLLARLKNHYIFQPIIKKLKQVIEKLYFS